MLDFNLASATEICKQIGQRLRTQRLALLWTQAELAARTGVSTGTVRTLETTGLSSTDTLVRVALSLGLAERLQSLFVLPVQSIAQMEQMEQMDRAEGAPRKRAPRRTRP